MPHALKEHILDMFSRLCRAEQLLLNLTPTQGQTGPGPGIQVPGDSVMSVDSVCRIPEGPGGERIGWEVGRRALSQWCCGGRTGCTVEMWGRWAGTWDSLGATESGSESLGLSQRGWRGACHGNVVTGLWWWLTSGLKRDKMGRKCGENAIWGGKEKWDEKDGQKGSDKGRRALTSYHRREFLLLHCA